MFSRIFRLTASSMGLTTGNENNIRTNYRTPSPCRKTPSRTLTEAGPCCKTSSHTSISGRKPWRTSSRMSVEAGSPCCKTSTHTSIRGKKPWRTSSGISLEAGSPCCKTSSRNSIRTGTPSSCKPSTSKGPYCKPCGNRKKCEHGDEAAAEPGMQLHRRVLARYNAQDTPGNEQSQLLCELNKIYAKRLQEIDCEAFGDVELKMITYQEWAEMLVRLNENMVSNCEDLECSIFSRLQGDGCSARYQPCPEPLEDQSAEVNKYRKDICTLLEFIQGAYQHNNWDLSNVHFQTLTQSQVLCLLQPPRKCGGRDDDDSVKQRSSTISFTPRVKPDDDIK